MLKQSADIRLDSYTSNEKSIKLLKDSLHILYSSAVRDSLTCLFLPRLVSEVVESVYHALSANQITVYNDLVYQICCICRNPLSKITSNIRSNFVREHTMQRIGSSLELDSKSMEWISKLPGRNIREKLSGKTHLLGVKRANTYNTQENRILKAFVDLLYPKLQECEDEFFGKFLPSADQDRYSTISDVFSIVDAFKRSDAYISIDKPISLIPNNVLLNDKYYSVMYRCWKLLHKMEAQNNEFIENLDTLLLDVIALATHGSLYQSKRLLLPEQPCIFSEESSIPININPVLMHSRSWKSFLVNHNGRTKNQETGSIVHVDKIKGYGFIQTGSTRYFFTGYDLKGVSINDLECGKIVDFVPSFNDKGGKANIVRLRYTVLQITWDKELSIHYGNTDYTYRVSHVFTQDNNVLVLNQIKNSQSEHLLSTTADFIGIRDIVSTIQNQVFSIRGLRTNEDNSIEVEDYEIVGVDFLTGCLKLYTQNGKQTLPYNLVYQKWNIDGEEQWIAPALSNCFILDPKNPLISSYDVLYRSSHYDEGDLVIATNSLAEQIFKYIPAVNIAYTVPDNASFVDLVSLRSALNVRYSKAFPVPRSIASALAWQKSTNDSNEQVNIGDCLLVFDSDGEVITITPLFARNHKDSKRNDSTIHDLYWERHPTRSMDTLTGGFSRVDLLSTELISRNVNEQESKSLAQSKSGLWGLSDDCLIDLDVSVCGFDKNVLADFIVNKISEFAKSTKLIRGKIYVLLVGEVFDNEVKKFCIENKKRDLIHTILNDCVSVENGAYEFVTRHLKGEKTWVDFLPELSIEVCIDGHYQLLNLIRDKSLEPVYGKEQIFVLDETFVLNAGVDEFHFPLYMGSEGSIGKQYEAVLKSNQLPLQTDLYVGLQIVYKYGSDNMFDLRFISNDNKRKDVFVAKWKEYLVDPSLHNIEKDISGVAYTPADVNDEEMNKMLHFIDIYNGVCSDILTPSSGVRDADLELVNRLLKRHSITMLKISNGSRYDSIETIHNTLDQSGVYRLMGVLSGIATDAELPSSIKMMQKVIDIQNETLIFLSSFGQRTFPSVRKFIVERFKSGYSSVSFVDIICLSRIFREFGIEDESIRDAFISLIKDFKILLSANPRIINQVLKETASSLWYNNSIPQMFDPVLNNLTLIVCDDLNSIVTRLRKQYKKTQSTGDLDPKVKSSLSNAVKVSCEILLAVLIRWKQVENKNSHQMRERLTQIAMQIREIDSIFFKIGISMNSRIRFNLIKPNTSRNMSDLVFVLNCFLTGSTDLANIEMVEVSYEY